MKNINKKGALALSQIFVLIISIIAIGWALGSQVGEVEGEDYGNYYQYNYDNCVRVVNSFENEDTKKKYEDAGLMVEYILPARNIAQENTLKYIEETFEPGSGGPNEMSLFNFCTYLKEFKDIHWGRRTQDFFTSQPEKKTYNCGAFDSEKYEKYFYLLDFPEDEEWVNRLDSHLAGDDFAIGPGGMPDRTKQCDYIRQDYIRWSNDHGQRVTDARVAAAEEQVVIDEAARVAEEERLAREATAKRGIERWPPDVGEGFGYPFNGGVKWVIWVGPESSSNPWYYTTDNGQHWFPEPKPVSVGGIWQESLDPTGKNVVSFLDPKIYEDFYMLGIAGKIGLTITYDYGTRTYIVISQTEIKDKDFHTSKYNHDSEKGWFYNADGQGTTFDDSEGSYDKLADEKLGYNFKSKVVTPLFDLANVVVLPSPTGERSSTPPPEIANNPKAKADTSKDIVKDETVDVGEVLGKIAEGVVPLSIIRAVTDQELTLEEAQEAGYRLRFKNKDGTTTIKKFSELTEAEFEKLPNGVEVLAPEKTVKPGDKKQPAVAPTVVPPVPKAGEKYKTGVASFDELFLKEGLEKGPGLMFANAVAHLYQGATWGYAVYKGIGLAAPMIEQFTGLEEEFIEAAGTGLGIGTGVWRTSYGLFKEQGVFNSIFGKETVWYWNPTSLSIGIGIAATMWAFYNAYEKDEIEVHTFTCYPWEAPIRGKDCEECNNQADIPCTEYQCKSLGQACELLNPGTGEEKCVWVNRDDVNPPEIDVLDSALIRDYAYNPTGIQFPNRDDRGVKIDYLLSDDRCIPAFTPLSLGIELDEPAKCKIDISRKNTFDDMSFYMSNSLSAYEHSYAMSLPSLDALAAENITLQNDGEYNLYVRCMDANGNFNIGNFVFNFCVDPGPDTTPPLIVGNTVGNKAFMTEVPIRYNQTSMDVEIYVNEPAECKWSHRDQSYESMEEELSCPQIESVVNLQSVYACSTTLTGLKDRFNNEFYFRCKDSSENVNGESHKLVLVGTQPLVIQSASPNNTIIKDSTDVVKVTLEAQTSAGYKEGEATCYYSETGREDDYIMFFYDEGTSSYTHSQDLWLAGDADGEDYLYYVKCEDFGGNLDYTTLDFTVQTDLQAPIIIRAYHEENYLKLITDERADCVYDIIDCSYEFDDGISMTSIADTSHFTTWDTNKEFYVKCKDDFGNLPDPDQCSIIVRPSEV